MRYLMSSLVSVLLFVASAVLALEQLRPCGGAFFYPSQYTCYDGETLCPITNGQPTLPCGDACYLPSMYSCVHDKLVYPPVSSECATPSATASCQRSQTCSSAVTRFQLNDPPYSNYFYSDCHSASQVVVTSPLTDSNLTIIGPRLLVAWPAGNSGLVAFFAPRNGINGTLSITLENSTTTGYALEPLYEPQSDGNPEVGVSGYLRLNSSASLTVPVLGSIRTIRDFVEGPSLLQPVIQDALQYKTEGEGAAISRLWLDNKTTTTLSFTPAQKDSHVNLNNRTLEFEAGLYMFNASFNYPQLTQLGRIDVLNEASQSLINQFPDQTQSLAFLSYDSKLLAGAWRFLTYFGRDSMIFMLLSSSILSAGNGSALEAGITAVLDRINQTDGSACHEETIGDYATYLNMQQNMTSTSPQYDYKMVDTDLYLPILMVDYFIKNKVGKTRRDEVLNMTAAVEADPFNKGLTYQQLAQRNAERIMNETWAFAQPGGQTKENLIHLKADQIVGQWRDSTYGIGGGRIPYDVNTALVPAALRAIADLAAEGFYPDHPGWGETASRRAQIWEDKTLDFFEVGVTESQARDLVQAYVKDNRLPFPPETASINTTIKYHALALHGNNDQALVNVMNTDDCFRHFLLNTTNQTQLSSFISQTADHILAPFPVGLSTDAGLLVANPAYGGVPVYAANFSNSAYHGTVIWSWQLAMMGAGLERQLGRCNEDSRGRGGSQRPDFCRDSQLYGKVLRAYNHLWNLIEANEASLSSEVWSWRYRNGKFVVTPLGELPPPPGSSPTESDIRQLWSLTFLAVKRNKELK